MDIVSKIGIFFALLALGVSVGAFFAPYEWLKMPPWVRRTGLGMGFIFILGAFACFFVLPDKKEPEVTLRFVIPKGPDIQLVNTSETVATNIKWMVAAWNLDFFANRGDPLPIPARTFDLLTPKNATLPINVFQTPTVAPFVKLGNRIFGSASVICPACTRGRTFWFYIVWGEGGWYSEIPERTDGNVVFPSNTNYIEEFSNQTIKSIPLSARVSIKGVS